MGGYILGIYKRCAEHATKRLMGGAIIIPGMVALMFLWLTLSPLFLKLGFLGGFFQAILESGVITLYLGWLRTADGQQRVRFSDLKEFDLGLFQAVISVLFIVWLAEYVLNSLVLGMQASWALLIFQLVVVVVLNSLAEVLYRLRLESMTAIQEAFSFTTRNWIEWFLPYVLVLSPLWLTSVDLVAVFFARAHVLLPVLPVIVMPYQLLPGFGVVTIVLGVIVAHWLMLFRGKLFDELLTGSRRQRMFKARMSG